MEFSNINLPISFRVFGFGDEAKRVLDEIDNLGYDGVETTFEKYDVMPSEDDRLVIILASTPSDRVTKIANSFYQASVLTLIVSSQESGWKSGCFDSLTVAPANRWENITKALLDPMSLPSRICLDYNDLAMTLKGSQHFSVFNAVGNGKERFKDAIQIVSDQLREEIENIEKVLLIIYFNRDVAPTVVMSEMQVISDFIQLLPAKIDVIWGLYLDDNMDCESIRISALLSGKNFTAWKNA